MPDPQTPSGRTLAQWLTAPSPVTPESGVALIVGAERWAAEQERHRIVELIRTTALWHDFMAEGADPGLIEDIRRELLADIEGVEPVALEPGCRCPTFWHGILPPPCPLHNPTTPGVVTRTSANTGEPVAESEP